MLFTVKLLGQFELIYQNKPLDVNIDRKSLALIAYLVTTQKTATRAHLAELLWGPGKLNNLRQSLYKIRQLPDADRWFHDEDNVGLTITSDVNQFENLIEKEQFAEALELWQGGFLEDFKAIKAPDFMDWLELERSRLNSLHQEASDALLEQLEKTSDFKKALPLAKNLLARDPLNETAHRAIMRLEHARGDTEAALEQFELLRQKLKEELGVEPLAETLELLKEIEQGGAGSSNSANIITGKEDIPTLPAFFIGRESLLRQAQDLLNQHNRVLIHGFGGIGKTALAAFLASNYLEAGNLLWLELGQSDLASSLDALAKAFNAQQPFAQTRNQAGFIKSLFIEQNISLIVLDDVWNAYTLSVLLETLPQDIPTLITSRQRYPRLKRVNVGRLERAEALELLNHAAKRNLEDASALCEHLGDHAYAIRVAGINLKQSGQSPDELLESIKNAPHDLRIPQELTREEQGSIANLLKVSLEPLDDRAYEAFLAYGGLFSSSATPELVANMLERPTETIENALFTLNQHGLAERSSNPGSDIVTYRLHDLAHSYTKAINNHRNKTVIQAAMTYLKNHKDEPDTLDADIQNILGASGQANDAMLVEFMKLLTLEGTYYISRGHSPQSIHLLEEAANVAGQLSVQSLAHELLAKIGNYYLNYLGNFEKALPYYEQALQLSQSENDLGRQAAYHSLLGIIYLRRKEGQAETYFQKALELSSNLQESLDLCIVLNNNGYFYAMKGDFESSISFYKRVVDVCSDLEKKAEFDSSELIPRRFMALLNIGQGLHELKQYDEALPVRKEALELAQKHDNHLWTADALYGLGETYDALEQFKLAQTVLNKSLSIYKSNRATAYIEELSTYMHQKSYLSDEN